MIYWGLLPYKIHILDTLLYLIILTYSGARMNTDKNLNAEILTDKEIAEKTDKVLLLTAQLLIKNALLISLNDDEFTVIS